METSKRKWISVSEMQDRLSISRNFAYRIANSGCVEAVRIGRSLRISEDSLNRWLESLSFQDAEGGDAMK